MPHKLYVGMDLHKRTSTFCVKTKDGDLVSTQKALTDPNTIRDYICSFKDQSLVLALEPVSQWYFYADMLESLGCEVHIAHPMRVKAIASARIKTDKIDASVLCDLLRANLLPESYFSPPQVRSWKESVRFRASLIGLRTQLKNKVHAILHKHALKHNFSNLLGAGGRRWLAQIDINEPFNTSLQKYLLLIDKITKEINEAEKRVISTVKKHQQAELLTTIPGVSYITALTIMAEIGDIKRFLSAKKLQGYAGLVPSTYSSGDTIRHGKITKQGSKWLRTIMIEAAHHQIRCKKVPGFGSYYLKLKKRKGAKTAAVATARKLLAVVWRILMDQRPFEITPPHHGKARMRV